VALEIYPDLNVFEVARPYALRLAARRYRPDVLADRVRGDVARYAEALLDYPFQLSELLDEFKDGDIEIRIRPEGFTDAVDKAQGSANRLALSLIAAALIISSAVVAVFADSTGVAGLALIALPGLILALVLVGWVVLGVLRSGRW
jgi:ubiquinone biosynthesis protein